MLGRAARQSLQLSASGAERSDISQEVPTHQEKKLRNAPWKTPDHIQRGI